MGLKALISATVHRYTIEQGPQKWQNIEVKGETIMKIKNGSSAIVFGLGVFIASTAVQVAAQNAVLRASTNPGNTNQEVRHRAALIHEETVAIGFDNTGVTNTVISLAACDKNAVPNC